MISNYFDSSDYENPIHYFLDDIWVSAVPNRTVVYQTFIKKNIVSMDDDYFGMFNSKNEDYFY